MLSEGKITDEGVQRLRRLVGQQMRQPFRFNTEAAVDPVRHFCWGIGDLNPLWMSAEHAKDSAIGRRVAPPSYLYTIHPGYVQIGLPGVHGFHANSTWAFYDQVEVGAKLNATCWLSAIEERPSQLSGKSVWGTFTTLYSDENHRVLAENVSTSIRTERAKSRKTESKSRREMKLWEPEELSRVEKSIAEYKRRGEEPRYFEEVSVGDKLFSLLKGPLTTTDMIAWYIGCLPVYMPAHEAALRHYEAHPKWTFVNPTWGVREPNIRVHENVDTAQSAGASGPYDVGIQRNQWLMQLLTDWGGDASSIESCYAEYRALNLLGDLTSLGGEVVATREGDGHGLVDVELHGTNQEGTVSMPGRATVRLPRRDGRLEDAIRIEAPDLGERIEELCPDFRPLPE